MVKTHLRDLRNTCLTAENWTRARHTNNVVRWHAIVAITFAGNLHTVQLRALPHGVHERLVFVVDEKAHEMREGLQVHVNELSHVGSHVSHIRATVLVRSAVRSHRSAPAHAIHALRTRDYSAVALFVVADKVVVVADQHVISQVLASSGVRPCCSAIVDTASMVADGIPVFQNGTDCGCPHEAWFVLIGEKDDNAYHTW
jgi:hypothetical protein